MHDTLFTKSGTKDHPVVYQCSKGTATYQFIDLINKEWVYIEGLKIVNTKVTYIEDFGAGIRMDGARNCVVRRCTINSVFGIVAGKPGATNCYFSDNVLTGTCEWKNKAMGKYAKNLEEGIQITGSGDVILHNTVIKVGAGLNGNEPMDFACFRNNLAIGGPNGNVNYAGYGAGPPSAAYLLEPGKHSDLDYDAVGVYGTEYVATIGKKAFSEVEKHGIERITIEDVFNDVKFPYPPFPEKEVPDLRPKPNSKVVDSGFRIPNVNDDYKGKAPDCGAYESGQELPHYGPRQKKDL